MIYSDPEIDELMVDCGKTVEAVGRKLGSKKHWSQEDFDHLINTLRITARTLQIIKKLEYNLT